MTNVSVQQMRDANMALGAAAAYVASHPPFGSYRADMLLGSIMGQIRRRHYAFAMRNGVIVGYVGWALCQSHIAEAWVETARRRPSSNAAKATSWFRSLPLPMIDQPCGSW